MSSQGVKFRRPAVPISVRTEVRDGDERKQLDTEMRGLICVCAGKGVVPKNLIARTPEQVSRKASGSGGLLSRSLCAQRFGTGMKESNSCPHTRAGVSQGVGFRRPALLVRDGDEGEQLDREMRGLICVCGKRGCENGIYSLERKRLIVSPPFPFPVPPGKTYAHASRHARRGSAAARACSTLFFFLNFSIGAITSCLFKLS